MLKTPVCSVGKQDQGHADDLVALKTDSYALRFVLSLHPNLGKKKESYLLTPAIVQKCK